MKTKQRVVLVLLGAVLTACSSAPKEDGTVRDIKNRAAEYAEYGNRYYLAADYDQALKFFTQALEMNLSVDNTPGIVESHNSLGKVYLRTGEHEKSEYHLYKAYAMSSETSDLSRLKTLSNLVEYHLALGEMEETRSYIEDALPLAERHSKSQDAAILYHNTAVVYRREEDYQRSIEYIQKALEINTKLRSFGEMASNYYILASIYSRLNKSKEALEYAELALTHDKKVENRPGIAADLLALGILHQKEGNEETAYTYFEKAYLVYETLHHPEGIKRSLHFLKDSAVSLGKDEDAEVYTRTLEIVEERS